MPTEGSRRVSFRMKNSKLWDDFVKAAHERGESATDVLVRAIQRYMKGSK